MPRLIRKSPTAKWESVLDEVNNLLYFAKQEAIASHKTYRLHFFIKRGKSSVIVEVESPNPEKPEKKMYKKITSYYFNPIYNFPKEISLQAVYHGKIDQLDEYNDNAYCYIIPNGLVQEIYVHLLKEENGRESKRTFKIEPFLGKFELIEGFVKPKR